VLEGYPLPPPLRGPVSISAACGLGTAPVCWFQFHAIPLLTVPANAAAAPVVAPMLGLALVSAVVAPVAQAPAVLLAGLNGWCAAYLAGCAAALRRAPRRADPLARSGCRARRVGAPGRGLCLASWRPS